MEANRILQVMPLPSSSKDTKIRESQPPPAFSRRAIAGSGCMEGQKVWSNIYGVQGKSKKGPRTGGNQATGSGMESMR